MMRNILISRLNDRNNQAEPSAQRTQRMARQPGREICNSLTSLQEEIEKLNPHNKAELIEAVQKLWQFRGCDKIRSD